MDYSEEGAFLVNFFKEHPAKYKFLVDVGAFTTDGSNTLNLLELGWSGLLIEPMPIEKYYRPLVEALKGNDKVKFCNLAISDFCGTAEGFEYYDGEGALAGHSSMMNETYDTGAQKMVVRIPKKKFLLTVSTLPKVLEDYNVPLDFDVLSVDAEGMDFRILKHLFLKSSYRPKIIVVEWGKDFPHLQDWETLESDDSIFDGYELLLQTQGNRIILRK
jgi:FkbM family methyltransferase